MIIIGAILGFLIGGVVASGFIAALGLAPAIAGILTPLVAALAPVLGPFLGILSIPIAMLVAGLGILVLTIVAYGLAAVSLLGATPAGPPAPPAIPTNPLELFCRGFIIGLTTAVNAIAVSLLTGMPPLTIVVTIIGLLAAVPPVAANRTVFQPILGLVSWVMPMTWVVMPVGVLLFVLNLPFVLAGPGLAGLRFDRLTATIETSGGALLTFLFGLSPMPASGFNLGNFTFLNLPAGAAPAVIQSPFGAAGLSSHETGHTITVAALGGFFGWINAIDENVPPLTRGAAAYGEIIPEGHFGGTGRSFLPMW